MTNPVVTKGGLKHPAFHLSHERYYDDLMREKH
jgi:hypothetical protein